MRCASWRTPRPSAALGRREAPQRESFSRYGVTDIDVGVDSGQAGFFDHARYVSEAHGPEHEAFYDAICDETLSADHFGTCRVSSLSQ